MPATNNTLVGENQVKKLVIVINGAGGVGKDTLIGAVAEKYGTRNISSVDPIKELARQAGWTGEKDDKSRKMLSDLKAIFTEYNDLSLAYIKSQYEQFLKSDEQVLFVHIREPEQIERFVETAPTRIKTLLVARLDEREYGNDSDDRVHEYSYDLHYSNHFSLELAKTDFLNYFDEWFEECAFDTDASKKTLTATFDNGFWHASIKTEYGDGRYDVTEMQKCSISVTRYATDGNNAVLYAFTKDAAAI